MNIELYIGGQQVDLSENTNILFNYKQKEMTNPTVVKNSFTKSIELEGTPQNDKVFGHLWNLERVQGNNFNPSKRVPFELYRDADLIETGYCKLDSIKRKANKTYSITLYGGLGQFFYNLMFDSNTGLKRNLASLDYGYDLDFTINKDTVNTAWQSLLTGANDKWGKVINFAPCYNGHNDKIDTEKVLVNTKDYTGVMRQLENNVWTEINGFPTSKDTYKLYNGYGLAELSEPMTEWETRDLRSYIQRPVIRMSAIVEACCKPENNGGYEVVLDDDFFTDSNPYYGNAFVTLPLLTDMDITSDSEENVWQVNMGTVSVTGQGERVDIDLATNIIQNAEYRLNVNLEGTVKEWSQYYSGTPGTVLYTSAYIRSERMALFKYGGYAVQMVGLDSNGNEVCGSDIYWCTSALEDGKYLDFNDVNYGFSQNDFKYGTPVLSKGLFSKSGNRYRWNSNIALNMKTNNTLLSKIRLKVIAGGNNANYGTTFKTNALFNSTSLSGFWMNNAFVYTPNYLADLNGVVKTGLDNEFFSNKFVTKSNLLSTEYSPAEYLLSYCKMFNLYFEKDPWEKKLWIRTQNNFYDGETIDLEELIDYSKDVDIKPLTFDSNWYNFNYKSDNMSSAAEEYKKQNGVDYGIQRVATGYEFDGDEKKLLDNNIFQNGVSVLETSGYYSIRQSDYYNECPTFLYKNVTFKLFDNNFESTDLTLSSPQTVIEGYFNRDSRLNVKYDAFPKVQFHKENEPVDGDNVLLFYNGFQNITSTSVYQPYYYLTDDVPEMLALNDDKPCWLYTQGTTNQAGDTIAIRLTSLPQFGRYTTIDNRNEIHYTWDFGRALRLFVPNYNYISENTTIYERYWQNYIRDLYDVNTRIVTAYVRFKGKVVQEYLKHFYWFQNSYWVINEIIDYNPDSPSTVKVKFIKVNDLSNYTIHNAQMPQGIIKIILDKYNIDANGGVIGGYVYVDDGGAWYFENWSEGLTPSVIHGTGNTYFNLTVAPWTGTTDRNLTIYGYAEYGDEAVVVQKSIWSSFQVDPRTIELYPAGGSSQINISNPNGWSWYIIDKPDWVEVDLSGSSATSSTITVTAGMVPINTSRSGSIYIYLEDAGISVPVNVSQVSAGEIVGNTSGLTVTQFGPFSHGNVDMTGGTCLYTIRSTAPWTVTTTDTYCTPHHYSGTGNTEFGETLEVYWGDNTGGNMRYAVLRFTNTDGKVVTATKYQQGEEGGEYYLNVDPAVTYIPQSGDTQTITIDTNDDWTLN